VVLRRHLTTLIIPCPKSRLFFFFFFLVIALFRLIFVNDEVQKVKGEIIEKVLNLNLVPLRKLFESIFSDMENHVIQFLHLPFCL
jgi:hypothetical protein